MATKVVRIIGDGGQAALLTRLDWVSETAAAEPSRGEGHTAVHFKRGGLEGYILLSPHQSLVVEDER